MIQPSEFINIDLEVGTLKRITARHEQEINDMKIKVYSCTNWLTDYMACCAFFGVIVIYFKMFE